MLDFFSVKLHVLFKNRLFYEFFNESVCCGATLSCQITINNFSSKWGPSTNIYLLSQIWKFRGWKEHAVVVNWRALVLWNLFQYQFQVKKMHVCQIVMSKNMRQGSFYFNLAPISNLSINTIILLMIDYSVTKA